MRKVLITGGAGFVGRRMTKRFLDLSDEVHCVDSVVPLSGGIEPERWPLFQPGDYSNFRFYRQDCRDWFCEHLDDDFDYCLHLAAMVGGRLVIENDPLVVADDLSIDACYWRWAANAKPRKTVCFSSSAAYPIRLQTKEYHVLLREDMIDLNGDIGKPDMSYGWAKLTCEYLAQLAWQNYGLKSVCYRPFSGYGEDQDDSYPFPSIVKRALANRGKPHFEVWGTGDQQRDFIHIEDCVDGVLTTMDAVDDAGALNLSTGRLTSFKEFARIVTGMLGDKPEIQGTSSKPEGVFARGGDTTKQREYGFTPKISFEEGIRRALDCS